MKVTGYTWLGVQTEDFEGTVRFFRDLLGLPVDDVRNDEDFAYFKLPSGQVLEVFGPKDEWHGFLRSPVVGFEVEDVRAARAEMEARGAEFITDVMTWGKGTCSCYFRGPDGHLYEIWQRTE